MDGAPQITIVDDNPDDVLLVRKALENKGIIFAMTCFEKCEPSAVGQNADQLSLSTKNLTECSITKAKSADKNKYR
jgi:CheY-like chemotaxis protein